MNWKAILFCTAAALLAISSLQAREKSDIVVMKNGDKITCEIKSLSSDTLYINVDYMLGTLFLSIGPRSLTSRANNCF
jgi:hypothetical protein